MFALTTHSAWKVDVVALGELVFAPPPPPFPVAPHQQQQQHNCAGPDFGRGK